MNDQDYIIINGLRQNNLKNISLKIPKNKIVVFTGLSGSGKSSIVFDTIAAESQRQMNETYSPYIRSRLPKYEEPDVDEIINLSPSVVVDQSRLGGNKRSTVGTITDMYATLRVIFSRIGKPYIGTSSKFSFNDPQGMCPRCFGMGKVLTINIEDHIDYNKSWNEGCFDLPSFRIDNWYWKKYRDSGLFNPDTKYKDLSLQERNHLLYGSDTIYGPKIDKKIDGVICYLSKTLLKRDLSNYSENSQEKINNLIKEDICPCCHGLKINNMALSSLINGYNISDLTKMEFSTLRKLLKTFNFKEVEGPINSLINTLDRLIDIGLSYLSMDRESETLSGGEAQRLKLVRYMGSSLTNMIYIFDEPTTGMHPRDVFRMVKLLKSLRDKGNTVLVVEHDKDIISQADYVFDIGPESGINGGKIVFSGTYQQLLTTKTITSNALNNNIPINNHPRIPNNFLTILNANVNNLKHVYVDIPLNVLTCVTGVAGSGKSSLIRDVFYKQYHNNTIFVDQSPITATLRSTPSSYMGIFDEIRNLFSKTNNIDISMFSFNSKGACPTCNGKGYIQTELVFMDPVVSKCEHCDGKRYSKEALSYLYKNKTIDDILNLNISDAKVFFKDNKKITKCLDSLIKVGLSYMSLGQPSSTMSGGEQQRLKLAKNLLDNDKDIYILDEPTTGLHLSDINKLMKLFNELVDSGKTVILIEHNLDVIKQCDYIIDIGPDGGKFGGEVVYFGTVSNMINNSHTITARCLSYSVNNQELTKEILDDLTKVIDNDQDVENYKTRIEEEDMKFKLNEIAYCNAEKEEYRIELLKEYINGLKGLEGFSHIQVLYWCNLFDNDEMRSLTEMEKPYTNGPDVMGTFSTRSPIRPNPIAVSVCKIKKIDYEKGIIYLDYLDALTGTPVIDIKPYTPSVDKVEKAIVPSWCDHWPKSYETSEKFDWEKELTKNN